jgi:hypothetical protein
MQTQNSQGIKEIDINFSSEENESPQIKVDVDLGQSIKHNYIPLIQIDIQSFIDELRNSYLLSKKNDYIDPPFIAETYGKDREKVLTKLKKQIGDLSKSQQNYYKAQFFELEQKLVDQFATFYEIKAKYRNYIFVKNKLKVSSYQTKEELDLTQNEGIILKIFLSFRT